MEYYESSGTIVDFIGGPYDGYRYLPDDNEDYLVARADMPVSQNVLRAISGENPGRPAKARTVAVYYLARRPDGLRYEFSQLRAAEPNEMLDLVTWCNDVIASWREAH